MRTKHAHHIFAAFALKDIEAGADLYVSYGPRYWKKETKVKMSGRKVGDKDDQDDQLLDSDDEAEEQAALEEQAAIKDKQDPLTQDALVQSVPIVRIRVTITIRRNSKMTPQSRRSWN